MTSLKDLNISLRARWAAFVLLSLIANVAVGLKNQPRPGELKSGEPYYEIRKSKYGSRYFTVPAPPCSCEAGLPPPTICSPNLMLELKKQLAAKPSFESRTCLPNAGCSLGTETIYADCSS